jgi:hypothetical protein
MWWTITVARVDRMVRVASGNSPTIAVAPMTDKAVEDFGRSITRRRGSVEGARGCEHRISEVLDHDVTFDFRVAHARSNVDGTARTISFNPWRTATLGNISRRCYVATALLSHFLTRGAHTVGKFAFLINRPGSIVQRNSSAAPYRMFGPSRTVALALATTGGRLVDARDAC